MVPQAHKGARSVRVHHSPRTLLRELKQGSAKWAKRRASPKRMRSLIQARNKVGAPYPHPGVHRPMAPPHQQARSPAYSTPPCPQCSPLRKISLASRPCALSSEWCSRRPIFNLESSVTQSARLRQV